MVVAGKIDLFPEGMLMVVINDKYRKKPRSILLFERKGAVGTFPFEGA